MAYTSVDDPELYFQTKLYTGNGTSGTAITFDGSENMQPDWIWGACRSNGDNLWLSDSVRGNTKALFSNNNNDEETSSERIKSFDSNGFTIGDSGDTNTSSRTFVTWNWKAGTSFTNDASSTGIGTIDSTGSVSTDAGFSITSYTGTGSAGTIKHGLSTVPKMIITKKRSASQGWHVQHARLGATKELYLNTTDAVATGSTPWNDTAPTSSVFSVGTSGGTNGSSATYIAYCFAEKQGYSKFGSYTGNGNADGNFIYTGFRPAFILLKNTGNSAAEWRIYDNKRDPSNVMTKCLQPHTSDAEETTSNIDFLSNGWKVKSNDGNLNQSGYNFIYMAFAESPFVNSNGIPNNAR